MLERERQAQSELEDKLNKEKQDKEALQRKIEELE